MQIVWTKHANDRYQAWQQRLGITREQVEAILISPEQVVPEHEVLVAQSRYGNGVLRVVYAEIGSTQRIITLYWTNQFKRYWKENYHEI